MSRKSHQKRSAHEHSTLDNGVELHIFPTQSPTTTLFFNVKQGMLSDPSARMGEMHLLEHLFFADRHPALQENTVSEYIESIGGIFNAQVLKEYSSYWVDCLPENAVQAAGLLEKLISSSGWDATTIESEHRVMKEEYDLYKTDYPLLLSDRMEAELIDGPLKRSHFSNFTELSDLTPEIFSALHKRHWQERPVQVFVVGATSDKLINECKKRFGSLPRNSATSRKEPEVETSAWKQGTVRELEYAVGRGQDESHLQWIFPLPEVPEEMDLLLAYILGRTSSSRLAQEARNRGLGYNLTAHVTSYSSLSYVSVTTTVPTEREQEVRALVSEILSSYTAKPLILSELRRAQTSLTSAIVRDTGDPYITAESMAHDLCVKGITRAPDERVQLIRAISLQQLQDSLCATISGPYACGVMRT